jgi:hypothetical protein
LFAGLAKRAQNAVYSGQWMVNLPDKDPDENLGKRPKILENEVAAS